MNVVENVEHTCRSCCSKSEKVKSFAPSLDKPCRNDETRNDDDFEILYTKLVTDNQMVPLIEVNIICIYCTLHRIAAHVNC